MSIEFFRPESQRPLDADGFELPPWLNPFFAIPPADPCEECESDDDEQDPDDWPTSQEIDGDRWEPGPDDVEWLNTHPIAGGSPADEDPAYDEWSRRLEEMHQVSEWQDRLEAIYHIDGDQAARDAGLAVG
jgi:hypothetical protein